MAEEHDCATRFRIVIDVEELEETLEDYTSLSEKHFPRVGHDRAMQAKVFRRFALNVLQNSEFEESDLGWPARMWRALPQLRDEDVSGIGELVVDHLQ